MVSLKIISLFLCLLWPHCSLAQSQESNSIVESECPEPALAPPPPGCEYEMVKDENGCDVPNLVCEKEEEEPFPCPVFSVVEPPEGCKYEWEKDENGCDMPHMICECGENEEWKECGSACPESCGTLGEVVKCSRQCVEGCFCKKGYALESGKGSSCIPVEKCPPKFACPEPALAPPPPGCEYEMEKDENGCDVPNLVCENEEVKVLCKPKPTTKDSACWYDEVGKLKNGCPEYAMVCAGEQANPRVAPVELKPPKSTTETTNCEPEPKSEDPYCFYEPDKADANGCPTWQLICMAPPRTTTTAPPAKCPEKPESNDPYCFYEYDRDGEDGCPKWELVCASPPRTTTAPKTSTESSEQSVNENQSEPNVNVNQDCSTDSNICSEAENCVAKNGSKFCFCKKGFARYSKANECKKPECNC